jgi:hypothetical protein
MRRFWRLAAAMDFRAGIERAIALGWLWLHESGTYVSETTGALSRRQPDRQASAIVDPADFQLFSIVRLRVCSAKLSLRPIRFSKNFLPRT